MLRTVELKKDEIVEILRSDEAAKVFRDHEVLAAYLFGSLARERTHAESDIDIAIVFERSVDRSCYSDHRLRILMELSRILPTDEIDVVTLNEAPLLLAFQVLRDRVVLYSVDEHSRAEFEIKMVSMYYDFLPSLDYYRRELFRQIKEHGLR
jgi:uncharacterized protein